jgi:hypothetical protein
MSMGLQKVERLGDIALPACAEAQPIADFAALSGGVEIVQPDLTKKVV